MTIGPICKGLHANNGGYNQIGLLKHLLYLRHLPDKYLRLNIHRRLKIKCNLATRLPSLSLPTANALTYNHYINEQWISTTVISRTLPPSE